MMRHWQPGAAVLLLLGTAPAQADDAKLLRQEFQRLDVDKDGALQRKEFPGSDRQFAAMDADKDGKASLAEYLASDVAQRFLRAAVRNRAEARPRTGAEELALARLAELSRFDKNRDGKVTREEWTGTDAAFLQLDLDGNGVLDRRDRAEAAATAPEPEPPLPELRDDLPSAEELLEKLDRDKDGKLSPKEVAGAKVLAQVFARGDTDRNQFLDERELRYLIDRLRQHQAETQRARGKPQAFEVPFDTWDTDKDGKIQQNEWQGARNLFDRIDLDRDAAVTKDEVARYEKRVEGDDFVERFDLDGDGKVTPAEFGGPPDAFRRADRNGDGVITRADR